MKRFIQSFKYAIQGMRTSIADQPNLKVLLVVAVAVVSAGFFFQITSIDGVSW